jgi:hypothetical protein
MSFRAGTPYPSMPVLVNIVQRFYPQGYASLHPGLSDSCRPVRGLFYSKPASYPDIEFCINILLKYFMGYLYVFLKNLKTIRLFLNNNNRVKSTFQQKTLCGAEDARRLKWRS